MRTFLRSLFRDRKRKDQVLKLLFIAIVLISVLGGGALLLFAVYLPDPARIEERYVVESTKIYDRTGKVVLYDIYEEEKRTVIPFSEIPEHVKEAAIAVEDQNFYSHNGIDVKAILRAFLVNLTGRGTIQGGSTITQQFVKNSILSPERTIFRKIKEAILALELERKYTKDEILGFYLNQISYGANAYGIESAAQTFFSKPARELTLAEAALLASLPKAPTYYSPYGTHLDDLTGRKNYVLEQMHDQGFITQSEMMEAQNETLEFSKIRASIKAPHFVFYIREYLEEKYGPEYLARTGLKIITTLDWELQEIAEEVVREGAERNQRVAAAYNAGLVATDPKTGQILAMAGSRDYFLDPLPEGCTPGRNCKFEPQVNVTLRPRQPGSSFKPYVYSTAFKKGYTDNTVLFDLFTEFNPLCTPGGIKMRPDAICYHPQNFDSKTRGPVTLRSALAQSLNIPSVKLLYLTGVDDSIDTAEDLGITTLGERERFGLALVLGGAEVKLLEHTAGFGVFATEGIRHPTTGILRIEDRAGNVLEEFKDEPVQVLDPEIARLISDILSDNDARLGVFSPGGPLEYRDRDVAAKTGTTNDFRDGWTVGYTPSLAAGVWVGNNDNVRMQQEPGSAVASPIWRAFMDRAFSALDLPPEDFTPPAPRVREKPVLNGQYMIDNEVHTILYYVSKEDPLGSPPQNSESDPLFHNWESGVRAWFGGIFPGGGSLTITSPSSGARIRGDSFEVRVANSAPETVERIDFFFDDELVGSVEESESSYSMRYELPRGIERGIHIVRVRSSGGPDGTFTQETSIAIQIGPPQSGENPTEGE